MAERTLSPAMLLRPLPPAMLVPTAALVLVAGAAYCLGYEALSGGLGRWGPSLVWSACAVWPWLLLFEAVKRREQRLGAPLAPLLLATLLVGAGAASIGAELLVDRLNEAPSAPVALQLMRRLPAIGATLLLLLLARREPNLARGVGGSEGERRKLLRLAPRTRWIRAADNYLELHGEDSVVTLRLTMGEAAALLEPLGFVRIHRSFIVARGAVDRIRRDSVRLTDGSELPVGRAFAARLG